MSNSVANIFFTAICALFLGACDMSEKRTAEQADSKITECADRVCAGDVWPKYDPSTEGIFKVNRQWFVGPDYYVGGGSNSITFEWWNHKPLLPNEPRPPDAISLAANGYGSDFQIRVLLRSKDIPVEPHGYRLIELADKNNWISERRQVRPGLDLVNMKHVLGPTGHYIDHVTYYVATDLVGTDGLPPVATCNHDHPRNGGGAGFMWQPGIWAGIQMNQRHCADWPEIYKEVIRVLKQIRKA